MQKGLKGDKMTGHSLCIFDELLISHAEHHASGRRLLLHAADSVVLSLIIVFICLCVCSAFYILLITDWILMKPGSIESERN